MPLTNETLRSFLTELKTSLDKTQEGIFAEQKCEVKIPLPLKGHKGKPRREAYLLLEYLGLAGYHIALYFEDAMGPAAKMEVRTVLPSVIMQGLLGGDILNTLEYQVVDELRQSCKTEFLEKPASIGADKIRAQILREVLTAGNTLRAAGAIWKEDQEKKESDRLKIIQEERQTRKTRKATTP
jgi:hypothetical protein